MRGIVETSSCADNVNAQQKWEGGLAFRSSERAPRTSLKLPKPSHIMSVHALAHTHTQSQLISRFRGPELMTTLSKSFSRYSFLTPFLISPYSLERTNRPVHGSWSWSGRTKKRGHVLPNDRPGKLGKQRVGPSADAKHFLPFETSAKCHKTQMRSQMTPMSSLS